MLRTLHGNLKKYPLWSATFAGALCTLGFAPFFVWPLAVLALALLFHLLVYEVHSAKKAALVGFLFIFIHHVTALHWVAMSFYMDSGSVLMAIGGGLLAIPSMAVYLSLFFIPACVGAYWLRKKPVFAALLFAVFVLCGEYLRSLGMFSFPWNLFGYVWAGDVHLMQLASFGRVFVLSFIVVLMSSLLALRSFGWCASLVLLFGVYAFGFYRLSAADASLEAVSQEKQLLSSFALVQGNVPLKRKWDPAYKKVDIDRHIRLSQQVVGVPFVVWPETAVLEFIDESPSLRAHLTQSIDASGYLVLGALRKNVDADGQLELFNSFFVLNGEGHIVASYDKKHLVPFGEYIPFRRYLPAFVEDVFARRINFTAGTGADVLAFADIVVRPLICFEAVSPFLPLNGVEDIILVVTNDAWFDGTIGPAQHLAQAKMRAVELSKPLVRVANTGISVFVDSYGRTLKELPQERTGVLLYDNID